MNLKEIIYERYQNVLNSGDKVMLVNFPVHFNVGDQAIFLGEAKIIEFFGASLVSVHSNFAVGDLETHIMRVLKNSKSLPVIAIHGGGSFGSIWPKEEIARVRYLELAIKYSLKVIQFPQSVNFQDDFQLNSIEIIRKYQDQNEIYVFARDIPSQSALDKFGIKAILCPDSAHVLELMNESPSTAQFTILKRRDKESSNESLKYPGMEWDWVDSISKGMRFVRLMMRIYGGLGRYLPWGTNSYSRRYSMWFSTKIMDSGLRRMQQSQIIYTDRLHAVLLSQMSEIEVILVRDRYSKIRNYLETWNLATNLKILDAWPNDLKSFPKVG